MGFEPANLGILHYARELGFGTADLAQIEILGTSIEAVRSSFKPHESPELQLQWHEPEALHYLPS